MAAIWRGTVSFGLVSIPVKLHSATEERGVSFRQVHEADGGRIRYKRVCSVDGEEVPYGDIAKGYELPDGDVVVLTDEDLSALPLPSRRTIEVLQFVPEEQIDGLYFSKGYYLSADAAGVKPYVLLRQALERAGKVALVKVALRNRESLAALRVRGGALVVQTMLWPDEIRNAAAYAPDEDVAVRDQEVAMAESYIETLSEDFDPSAFSDDYRSALEELVTAKAGGREPAQPDEEDGPSGTVVDLMAALRASVDAARQRREAAGAADEEPQADTASDGGDAPAAAAADQPAARGRRRTGGAAAKAPVAEEAPAAAAKAPAKGTSSKTGGSRTATAKSATAKSAPAETAPAKTTPAKTAPAKAAAASSATAKNAAAKSTTAWSAASETAADVDAAPSRTAARTPAAETAATRKTAASDTAARTPAKKTAARAPAKKTTARKSA